MPELSAWVGLFASAKSLACTPAWLPGKDTRELVAGADVELGEDLVQVVFGARAHEQPGRDLGVGQAMPASRAIWASRAVSGARVSAVWLRTRSPVASSSRLLRSANPSAPMTIGYLIGGGVMIIGGLVEVFLGIDAEGKPLEQVARPLTEVASGA